MIETLALRAVALALLAFATSGAMAAPSSANSREEPPQATAIAEGDLTLAPLSFVRFCMDRPEECRQQGTGERIVLDDQIWRALNDVNSTINKRIAPDRAKAGRHAWSLTAMAGDCNDYAIQKRHALLERGWPSAALLLAVVKTGDGTGHLVLTVKTDRGDVVLDNLREKILAWNNTDYRWLKRQSASEPKYWQDLKGGRAVPDDQRTSRVVPEIRTATTGDERSDQISWNFRFN